MAASLSRPDPTSPASVSDAGFSTARKGFDQGEVRAFLQSVAAEMGRLQERERQLEAELREARDTPVEEIQLDDDTVTRLLGEETLRVLQTARESASQIKIRAEDGAARVLRDATDEANRLRENAEVEASRKRADAAADSEAEVSLAKQQGREMVNEARAYRERVLSELTRRRELARQQIEQLIAGRDRLQQVFERARLVAVDVTSELQALGSPDEYVDLSPTTGPVPMMVPASSLDRTDAIRVDDEALGVDPLGDDTVDDPQTESGADDTTVGTDTAAGDPATDATDATDEEDGGDVTELARDEDADATADPTDEVDGTTTSKPPDDGKVVALFPGGSVHHDDEEGTGEPGSDGSSVDADGIFARLRSEVDDESADAHADADSDDSAGDADTDTADDDGDEPTPFSERDEQLVPLIVAAARKLKRVLADEQNGVLDTLRQKDPVTELAAILAGSQEHAARYTAAIEGELTDAAAAGATRTGRNDTKTLRKTVTKAGALDGATSLVQNALVDPLRDRLERSIADGDGDNDDVTKRVRSVYREWKTQHIDDLLDDVFRFAHGGGFSAAVKDGTQVVWSVDPSKAPCPDCEDNSLSGAVTAGTAFPTGHTAAPAHPGCRCLLLPEPR